MTLSDAWIGALTCMKMELWPKIWLKQGRQCSFDRSTYLLKLVWPCKPTMDHERFDMSNATPLLNLYYFVLLIPCTRIIFSSFTWRMYLILSPPSLWKLFPLLYTALLPFIKSRDLHCFWQNQIGTFFS